MQEITKCFRIFVWGMKSTQCFSLILCFVTAEIFSPYKRALAMEILAQDQSFVEDVDNESLAEEVDNESEPSATKKSKLSDDSEFEFEFIKPQKGVFCLK